MSALAQQETPREEQQSAQVQQEMPQTEQKSMREPSQTEDDRLRTVLKEYSDGVILNALGLKKFRAKYVEQYGEAPSGDLDALKAKLNRIGILVEGRIHAKPETGGILSEIRQAIDGAFQSGASCVYLECVQSRYQRELAEQMRIYNANALETVLAPVLDRQYAIADGLIRRRGHVVSVANDVLRVCKSQNSPQSYADLTKKLWYIPIDGIKRELVKEPSLVNVEAETYFYAPNLPVSQRELDIIADAMHRELDRKGFLVAKDIPAIMRESCPAAAVNTESFKDWGLRNVFAYLLRDRFSFAGRIIGPYGKSVDTLEVYRRHCASYDRLTLDELKEFAAETNVGIPWNAVLEVMIRISPTELLNRNRIHFDAAAVDGVLDRLCPGDYLPIQSVELFMQFPDIGIPWNGFVLESYLLSDSKKFRLYQVSGISTGNYYGVMVRADAPYNSYRDVIVDMLARSDRWNSADEAWRLILDQGCQARRSSSGMDAMIRDAKRVRMKKFTKV